MGPADVAASDFVHNAQVFLRVLPTISGSTITERGNLSRRAVAEMLPQMRWPPGYLEAVHRYNKKIDELDAFPLHIIRITLGLSGYLRKRKGFHVSAPGTVAAEPSAAGQLFHRLFTTYFRKLDFRYADSWSDLPEMQPAVTVALYRLQKEARGWRTAGHLAKRVWLETMVPFPPDFPYFSGEERLTFRTAERLLRPLAKFGLLEVREGKEKGAFGHGISEFRLSPLWAKFIRFELGGPSLSLVR